MRTTNERACSSGIRPPPGESKTYGLKFLVSDSIRNIEPALIANGRLVALGIPGYILPADLDAQLFLNYDKDVKSIAVEPSGAIVIGKALPTPGGWNGPYKAAAQPWDRMIGRRSRL